ncbi:PREDICTED: DDB1- and CUL4-associated factor 4 isoform X2 [Nicotiana attenuata]|uniref:DDB1- and CUL4-associated factor 4 isoform X2 n=1 Tax=Nicotiana attenuata TaxID=49451 RepID=UPI000905BD13|nr:PREDICTED: DDB1- and CUL4-associated factor 4 isoform X2 [Nicotiana attenuata]
MPKELPGFYYDAEKNRYFPIKGPIPGSSKKRKSPPPPIPSNKEKDKGKCTKLRSNKLLNVRELCGKVIPSRKGKLNFQMEFLKKQVSCPLISKYDGTQRVVDSALENSTVDINMPEGLLETDILLTGGMNGSLCIFEVGKVEQEFNQGVKCLPDRVWPLTVGYREGYCDSPGHLWRPQGAFVHMPSNISCIKTSQKHRASVSETSLKHVLITTLGAESSGGAVYILNLSEPLDFSSSIPTFRRRISMITSFEHTVWAADCSHDQKRAVVGTNRGAGMLDIETGVKSWVCRSKSDIFSIQFDNSENVVLCGLRNGTILAIDTRQKPGDFSGRLSLNRIPCHRDGHSSRVKSAARDSFQIKGKMHNTISMPSSVCCLVPLELYDQCFLASSMDGSIKLYDHRLMRGAIQSYEGNNNSHSRIQLGVDPSETIVMSGGEDYQLRLWSMKSGELLFEDKFMDTIPTVVRWPKTEGAWLGSEEGLFFMDWP